MNEKQRRFLRVRCKHRVGGFGFGNGSFVCGACGQAIHPERIDLHRLTRDIERVRRNKLRPDASSDAAQEFLDLELESCVNALRKAVETVKLEGPTEEQAQAMPAADKMIGEVRDG